MVKRSLENQSLTAIINENFDDMYTFPSLCHSELDSESMLLLSFLTITTKWIPGQARNDTEYVGFLGQSNEQGAG